MTGEHDHNKAAIAPLRTAMYNWTTAGVRDALAAVMARSADVRLSFPFEDLDGPHELWGRALSALAEAMPDVERRDTIVISGPDPEGAGWVGCGGYYTGTWVESFLDIPPTGHQAGLRFHEFYRFESGRIVEMQALWDIPELMFQADAWPMVPSLGREWHVPGPATQDGLVPAPRDPERSAASVEHVVGMLADMGRHPAEPEEVMRLERWWHPKFSWYGPAGIGTMRRIDGFRRHHQIPFLKAMPDRRGGYKGEAHFFGDGNYVGVTAWPGMHMTLSGDGWLGIPPTGASLTMRSLDFWRVERSTATGRLAIRENWVLVDLLHVWDQLGVDVFERMREVTGQLQRTT